MTFFLGTYDFFANLFLTLWNIAFFYTFALPKGEVAEWSIAAVLKTVDLQGSGGSNPPFSASIDQKLINR